LLEGDLIFSSDLSSGFVPYEGVAISLLTVIFPVSMLHNTSHHELWSSKILFVTPAINPGLKFNDKKKELS